jgi:hypothetical protein
MDGAKFFDSLKSAPGAHVSNICNHTNIRNFNSFDSASSLFRNKKKSFSDRAGDETTECKKGHSAIPAVPSFSTVSTGVKVNKPDKNISFQINEIIKVSETAFPQSNELGQSGRSANTKEPTDTTSDECVVPQQYWDFLFDVACVAAKHAPSE